MASADRAIARGLENVYIWFVIAVSTGLLGSMRRDEVEAAWTWADPILNAWAENRQETQAYTAGTWGHSASIALIERDGRTWHESD